MATAKPTRKAPNAAPPMPPLDSETATVANDPFLSLFMGVLRPNDPLILERGLDGSQAFELYRDLRRDGKVFAGMQKRKLAVVGRPWTVTPVSDDAAAVADAEVVSDILRGFSFDALCANLIDALLIGWQPAEIVWTLKTITTGGRARQLVAPARVVKRAHRRFVYVQEAGQPAELRMLTKEHMQRGVELPARKFIVHRVNPEDDNPYGTGLGLQLYWPTYFKRKGVLAWTKFLDRFGLPIPWGKYPAAATPREKGTLFDALRAVSNDGMIMTPEGTMIELLESKLTGGATPHQAHVEYMDDWIMEVILGQAPRGASGGALAAAANERQDVRLELSQADSDLLSETLNATLIKWICELNGLAPCTVYRKIEAEEDTRAKSDTDRNVAAMGWRLTPEAVKERYGEGWEPAPAPPPGATPFGAPSSFAEPSKTPTAGHLPAPQADAMDKIIAEELANWQPLADPMVAPVQALMDTAAREGWTAAELLKRLPEVLDRMDADALAQALTRTAFAARIGRAAGIEGD